MNELIRIYHTLLKEFGAQGWWPVRGGYFNKVIDDTDRFEVIIGALLTQNTSWKNADKAIDELRKANLINAGKLAYVDTERLKKLITSAGYYNQKALRLKNVAKYIDENYKSVGALFDKGILELRDELLSLNGIGPETADSIILYAAMKPVFVIDAYTRRIFSRIGFLPEDSTYDEWQEFFHRNLRKETKLFNEYHALIVELAKRNCRKEAECSGCVLKGVCRF